MTLPRGWEHAAPVASRLFDEVSSPALLFTLGALLLAGGLVLARRRPALSIALAVSATFLLSLSANGLVDDAFIQFRYAANLALGHGPVFNPGERIEGASGGLWIAVLGGLGALSGWDVASLGRLLSLVLAPLATLAAARAGTALAGAEAGAVAAVLFAAIPTPMLYAATGLETTAYVLALLAFVGGAARGSVLVTILAGIGIATLRPEGVVLGLAALPFARRLPDAARKGLVALLAAAAVLAAARLYYYGIPVPRSAVVKGVTGASTLPQGLRYLARAALEWTPLLVAIPAIVRFRSRLLPVIAPALVWTGLAVARGGDWMTGSRYLLPLILLLTLACATLVKARTLVAGALVVWGLVQVVPAEAPSRSPVGSLYRGFNTLRVESRWWESLGVWLAGVVPEGTRLASGPSGALPYASRLATFDIFGLCSPVTATRDGAAGHRLWGLADAVRWNADVVYPGQTISQTRDWTRVRMEAEAAVAAVPGFSDLYEPIGIAHEPEYHTDILTDVVWIRRGKGLLAPR